MANRRSAKPAADLADVAALDDPGLREKLGGLSLRAQTDLFRRSDWPERVKIVKNSVLAEEIVASMPDEEVLLTFKGAGEETGLALIPYCTGEQLRFILDIDLWSEHAVDEESVLKWLDYLVTSGEKTVSDFVHACDFELVAVFLGKLVRLIPFDDAVEMGEEITSIMPDEAFVVQSLVPEETPSIRLLLAAIRTDDRDLYGDLRYSMYRGIPAETEEEAYRWRNSRLEEKGILEYAEAAGIYEGLPESEMEGMLGGDAVPYYGGPCDFQVPAFYPLGLSEIRPLYLDLLEAIEDGVIKDRIAGDLSYVTNRLLIADGHMIGDVDATLDELGRLFSLANVGLLHLAERHEMKPAEVLPAVSVSSLFRVGYGLVTALGAEAEAVGRRCPPAPWGAEYALLEDFHADVLKGLRMKVPMHYDPGCPGPGDYRDFMTPEEVATARAVLAQISVLAGVFYGKPGLAGKSIESPPGEGRDAKDDGRAEARSPGPAAPVASRANFGNSLMTGFARFALDGKFAVMPLDKRELDRFLGGAFVRGGDGGRALDPALTEQFVTWLERETGLKGHEWAIFEAYVMERLEVLEEDFAGAASAGDVDAPIIDSLLLG
jgi:hypothetical protein